MGGLIETSSYSRTSGSLSLDSHANVAVDRNGRARTHCSPTQNPISERVEIADLAKSPDSRAPYPLPPIELAHVLLSPRIRACEIRRCRQGSPSLARVARRLISERFSLRLLHPRETSSSRPRGSHRKSADSAVKTTPFRRPWWRCSPAKITLLLGRVSRGRVSKVIPRLVLVTRLSLLQT